MGRSSDSSIVAKCALVIDVLSEARKPMSFSDIIEKTGFVKSSGHRILGVLKTENLVEYDKSSKTYRVGPRLRDWSRASWRRKDLQQAASEIMAVLGEATGMNVALSILDRDTVLYIRTVNIVPVRYAAHSGDHAPIHCTAAGKVILANLKGTKLDSVVKSMRFERFTEHTITDFDRLAQEFPKIRKHGYAVARGEEALQVTGIAAPIHDAQDEVIAALSLWSIDGETTPEAIISKSADTIDAADEISTQLGWAA